MLNVLYILEALRHNNIMPGLLPGWTRKDIEQQPNFFFRLRVEILNVLYILETLSIITSCQDFYLGEPERIQNNYLVFFGHGLACVPSVSARVCRESWDESKKKKKKKGMTGKGEEKEGNAYPEPQDFEKLQRSSTNVASHTDVLRGSSRVPAPLTSADLSGKK